MKLVKLILILLVVVGVGYAVWRFLPGVRTKVESTVEEYGGWTDDARREDPVGFLEYAQEKMSADLQAFQKAKQDLAAARVKAEEEMQKTEDLRAAAERHSLEFRGAFQAAEASAAFPVAVSGAQYERDDMIEQVRLLLLQRDNYAGVAASYRKVLDTVDARQNDLDRRILDTKAQLTNLGAQKELVRIQKLTEETDELMAQVAELLGENSEVLQDLDSPVRTVEELMRSGGGGAAGTPVANTGGGDSDVMAFLKGSG